MIKRMNKKAFFLIFTLLLFNLSSLFSSNLDILKALTQDKNNNRLIKSEINQGVKSNKYKNITKSSKKNKLIIEKKSKIEKDFNTDITSFLERKDKENEQNKEENKEENIELNKEGNIKQNKYKNITQYGYSIFEELNENKELLQTNINFKKNNYRLRPHDKVGITYYGNTLKKETLYLTDKGEIIIEKFLPVSLLNLTLNEAEKKLNLKFSKKFNNINLSLDVLEPSPIVVKIIGEVNSPGIYLTNDRNNLLSLLTLAGGVKKTGTLRNIQILRNNKKHNTVDLYSYLMGRSTEIKANLLDNDTIYIPVVKELAMISGQINRENIFELKEKTTLYELINEFGGKKRTLANNNHVFLYRKNKNYYHKISIQKKQYKKFIISNGDRVIVPTMNLNLSNPVRVEGEVANPGIYGIKKTLNLKEIINKSGGFTDNAEKKHIKLIRSSKNGAKTSISLNWEINQNFKLIKNDRIRIVSKNQKLNQEYVFIAGEVEYPGSYPIIDKINLQTIIKLAKPKKNANLENIEINISQQQKRKMISYDLNKGFELNYNDVVYIKPKKHIRKVKFIEISGEVNNPGKYPILDTDKISTIIHRAGGLTSEAYLKGLVLKRESLLKEENNIYNQIVKEELNHLYLTKPPVQNIEKYQSIQTKMILFLSELRIKQKNRISLQIPNKLNDLDRSDSNIKLEDQDKILIPIIPQSIQIAGGINAAGHYPFKKNKNTQHYINLSGGYTNFAIKNKFYVYKANGTMVYNPKIIERGDAIYIKEQIKIPINPIEMFVKVTQIIFNVLISSKTAGVKF